MSDQTLGNITRARVFSLIEILVEPDNQFKEDRKSRYRYESESDLSRDKRIIRVDTTSRALTPLIDDYIIKSSSGKIWGVESAKVWVPNASEKDIKYQNNIQTVVYAINRMQKQRSKLFSYISHESSKTGIRIFTIKLLRSGLEDTIRMFEKLWSYQEEEDPNVTSQTPRSPAFFPQSRQHEVTLKVGLASESSKPIQDVLHYLEAITSDLLSGDIPKLKFDPVIKSIHNEAYEAFWNQEEEQYDIIMLNDTWIPAFNRNQLLYPIEDTQSFKQFLEKRKIEKEDIFGKPPKDGKPCKNVFRQAFQQICIDGKIVALPMIGNIQMLIVRRDTENLIGREIALSKIEDIDILVQIAKNSGKKNKTAIYYRNDIKNAKVIVFWQLLRLLGYQDKEVNGMVYINRQHADRALRYLGMLSPIDYESLTKTLFSSEAPMLATIGWPSWDSVPQKELPGFDQIIARPISTPVMGTWSLALPNNPKNHSLREISAQVILLLTANQGIQSILAQQGNPHVLEELKVKPENWFWKTNQDDIRNAIGRSKPLPRSVRWQEVEDALSSQIEEGLLKGISCFESVPDLLKFTDDSEP
jgi:hypothetical protein